MPPASKLPVGIVGAGHLGLSLARILVAHGWRKGDLRIAHRGSERSLRALADQGWTDWTAPAAEVARCQVVFLTVRPTDLGTLDLLFPAATTVISCLAGCETPQLEAVLRHRVVRVLPSSPSSLEGGIGIAALFPRDPEVEALVASLGISVFPLATEAEFPAFTACLCLPAALLERERRGDSRPDIGALKSIIVPFSTSDRLLAWALSSTPVGLTDAGREDYITRMMTPGGVTEAMVLALRQGADLGGSFTRGMERSQELARGSTIAPTVSQN